VLALSISGCDPKHRQQLERLYRFLMATNMALLITCVVAVFFPALGPYELLNLAAADHPNISVITGAKMTEPILWIRAGVFGDPGPTIEVGLISFPLFTPQPQPFTWGPPGARRSFDGSASPSTR
jgi:hypothetical protein